MWVILMMVGLAYGAPLDEQKIYFPGENLEREVESRSYGVQQSPHQMQSSMTEDQHANGNRFQTANSQTSSNNVGHQLFTQLGLPAYGAQEAYSIGANNQFQSAQQPLPAVWGANLLNTGEGSRNFQESHPVLHSEMYPGININSGLQGQQNMAKHVWASRYSSAATGQHANEPHEEMKTHYETDNDSGSPLTQEQTFGSTAYHTNTKDLSKILDRPSSHQLHPNIKQALDNVIRDFGDASGQTQPSHHTVHKVSHIKKTTVQNVGREPSHIQSTSSNDDINLSHLIEELQILEQSPRHVNITWCEEKIKEFLQELRRKQASGIYISQQVQEQTLHHVLTHESSLQNIDSSGGVYEPLMTKVTVRPLGAEHLAQSQEALDITAHEQENHDLGMNVDNPQQEVNQAQEVLSNHEQPEIITVIPNHAAQPPEIMAHQHEHQKEVPPFTSDNTKELQELELELPEYVPIEHTHSGDVDMFENNIQREFRPIPPATEQSSSTNEMKEEIMPLQHETSQLNSNEETREYIHSAEASHHIVHGRPQALPEENSNTIESNNDSKHEVHAEKIESEENLPELTNAENHKISENSSVGEHHIQSQESSSAHLQTLQNQQINYDTLIEELIQLESIPGHQAIDKCEEKIQEFLEILKYQQEQGFGRNQQELEKLHQTLIEQAQERSKQHLNDDETTMPPSSFWRKVQKKIKKTYENAKDRAKEVIG